MRISVVVVVSLLLASAPAWAGPVLTRDIAELSTAESVLARVHGSTGTGLTGVPVAGAHDCDGDGDVDYAFASLQASPQGRVSAGEVYLVFGDGTLSRSLDTAGFDAGILKFHGDGMFETAGSALWMDEVTDDSLGDLLIARQNFSPAPDRIGAGALTIVVGGPELRTHAASLSAVDLRNPPAELGLLTLVGAEAGDRLGIWMRTGDVTGDGIADIVVGADQASRAGENHSGAAYLIRGGPHLAIGGTIDLADFGPLLLGGNVMKLAPPASADEFHFSATCQISDLDGDGRGEVLVAAALNRSGAGIQADGDAEESHPSGGSASGSVFIAWDDCFDPWDPGATLDFGLTTCGTTRIDGGSDNVSFGEELLGGLDFDRDGNAELFVGDLAGNAGAGVFSGIGHVFYDAAGLRGLDLNVDALPPSIATSTFLGAASSNIAADTALQGDFDGDGAPDLAFSSPHDAPLGRISAGTLHVIHGQNGPWPGVIDLTPGFLPASTSVRITEFYGANGRMGSDEGDTLAYSAAAADVDGDGRPDLITNEMVGNGASAGTEDVGNLIVLSGKLLLECGDVDDDGFVTRLDTAEFRQHLADPSGQPLSASAGLKCNTIGVPRPCDIRDVAVLERALATPFLPPGIAPTCPEATSP